MMFAFELGFGSTSSLTLYEFLVRGSFAALVARDYPPVAAAAAAAAALTSQAAVAVGGAACCVARVSVGAKRSATQHPHHIILPLPRHRSHLLKHWSSGMPNRQRTTNSQTRSRLWPQRCAEQPLQRRLYSTDLKSHLQLLLTCVVLPFWVLLHWLSRKI